MKERMTYTQWRPEERVVIFSLKLLGESTRAMARVCRHRTNTPHFRRLNIPQFDL